MIRLALALILLASPSLAGPILRVIDGDTYIIANGPDDSVRADLALAATRGKRLTYAQ